jgi:hypothetical protein
MAFAGNLSQTKKEFNTKIPGQIGYTNPNKKLRQQHNQYKNFAWLFKG